MAFLSALSSTDAIVPGPLSALVGSFGVALLGAGSGLCRESRLHRLAVGLPARLRTAAVAGAGGPGVYVACGALLVGISLAVHAGRVTSLATATDPGLVGGLGLLLVSLALVPNAVLWGAAFLAGPGVAVGAGTALGPFGVHVGAVPALPLLAALPGSDVPWPVTALVLLAPLGAGVLAGVLTHRRADPGAQGRRVRDAAGQAALAGPVAGAGLLVLAWLSGGPLGGGRLSDVGPSPWRVGVAVLVEVGVAAAATAAVGAWRVTRA